MHQRFNFVRIIGLVVVIFSGAAGSVLLVPGGYSLFVVIIYLLPGNDSFLRGVIPGHLVTLAMALAHTLGVVAGIQWLRMRSGVAVGLYATATLFLWLGVARIPLSNFWLPVGWPLAITYTLLLLVGGAASYRRSIRRSGGLN